MTTSHHKHEDLGGEVEAPAGYYQPLEEGVLDYGGRRVLYTRGVACIEASCCGVGSWEYLRVEGYVAGDDPAPGDDAAPGDDPAPSEGGRNEREVETIGDVAGRAAIAALLLERHPGARVEFR